MSRTRPHGLANGKVRALNTTALAGALLAVLSGVLNGVFTLPMRFLGRWKWENVWSVCIVASCVIMPAGIISLTAPGSWSALIRAPAAAISIALATGFAWGFGSVLFGQSVSAIGISLVAHTHARKRLVIRRPPPERVVLGPLVRISAFGFLSDFGFRASDFISG